MRPLDRHHVVVTGSSSGIGQAIATAAARSGAECLIHYRSNREGAEATAEAIRAAGSEPRLVAADLADPRDAERLVEEAFAWSPRIDAWIHNAGADVLTGAAARLSFDAKLARLWEVDVQGTIRLARSVAARMLEAPPTPLPASMLFIGWDQAVHGMEGDAGQLFGPIKAAVMAYAKSLAQTLAPRIRVNCVAPGWIRTAWGENSDPYWDARARNDALMHRWGTPEDVAAAAMYLISPQASFITGQVIEVNGGWNRKPVAGSR
ncbi:SDR family NAD(P)-dependent oxidoreductase [Candidatus Laterigemmans baculatus]|uniref:SDR family NAD(P)-dependent oxidoreductase n=1 Tax=Candidatus Laterigemmans baculatus TaxID=2770505 RepID=UPI0013D990DD|nr:SDR family oxidoreductase [Candidatus Laterigemmans baculatus]